MEFIKKHSDKIIISAGVAALFAGAYYFMKHGKKSLKEFNNKSENITANASMVFVKDDKYHSFIEKLKPMVSAELQNGELSKNTIITINQVVIHLFKNDYVRLLLEGRRVRRKFMDNLELYVREFMKNSTEAEKLMENASLEVLRDLNISLEEYEKNSERIMQSDPNFAMFNLYMFESVKMQVPSGRHKILNKGELLKILNFQKDQYADVDFSGYKVSPEQAMMLKQTYVSDRASLNFDYEEEDVMRNPALLQDPEVMDAQRQLQNAMMGEQGDYGNFA